MGAAQAPTQRGTGGHHGIFTANLVINLKGSIGQRGAQRHPKPQFVGDNRAANPRLRLGQLEILTEEVQIESSPIGIETALLPRRLAILWEPLHIELAEGERVWAAVGEELRSGARSLDADDEVYV